MKITRTENLPKKDKPIEPKIKEREGSKPRTIDIPFGGPPDTLQQPG